MGERNAHREITSAKEAADDALVLAFGRLQGAANRLEYILGRRIEEECGISHLMYEVLLILGRAGEPGLSMGAIGQEQVLSSGGVTRLVDRMEAAGLVRRVTDPNDRRGRLVCLTPLGEETAVRASRQAAAFESPEAQAEAAADFRRAGFRRTPGSGFELRGGPAGLPDRHYLWQAEHHALLGGVLLFQQEHVWVADTPTPADRAAWIDLLDEMAALEPELVVPGHRLPNTPADASAITATRDYLLAFEAELRQAADGAALTEALVKRYPDHGMLIAAQIGAKVAKGEMTWG